MMCTVAVMPGLSSSAVLSVPSTTPQVTTFCTVCGVCRTCTTAAANIRFGKLYTLKLALLPSLIELISLSLTLASSTAA